MADEPIQSWRLVRSTAGRDEGRYYLVLEAPAGGFVLLVDGDQRRAEKPKRKNRKHVAILPAVAWDLIRKVDGGLTATNAEIRRAIAGLVAGLVEPGPALEASCSAVADVAGSPPEEPRQ